MPGSEFRSPTWVEPSTGLPHRRRPVAEAVEALAAHVGQGMQPIHSIGPHASRFARIVLDSEGNRIALRAPAGQTLTSVSAARNRAPEPDRHEHPQLAERRRTG